MRTGHEAGSGFLFFLLQVILHAQGLFHRDQGICSPWSIIPGGRFWKTSETVKTADKSPDGNPESLRSPLAAGHSAHFLDLIFQNRNKNRTLHKNRSIPGPGCSLPQTGWNSGRLGVKAISSASVHRRNLRLKKQNPDQIPTLPHDPGAISECAYSRSNAPAFEFRTEAVTDGTPDPTRKPSGSRGMPLTPASDDPASAMDLDQQRTLGSRSPGRYKSSFKFKPGSASNSRLNSTSRS